MHSWYEFHIDVLFLLKLRTNILFQRQTEKNKEKDTFWKISYYKIVEKIYTWTVNIGNSKKD